MQGGFEAQAVRGGGVAELGVLQRPVGAVLPMEREV
jgi:hypothetical protein